MVGGGQGALIGAVHRLAARMDDRYELVAGCFASTPERSRASAAELGVAPERAYGTFAEMAEQERGRPDGIDVVAIVTPNHLHLPAAAAFLDGRHPRDLRQAADHDRGRRGGAGARWWSGPGGCSC